MTFAEKYGIIILTGLEKTIPLEVNMNINTNLFPAFQGYTQSRFDLTGQKFGALTVLYRYYENTKDNKIQWVCLCDCGQYTVRMGKNLRNGSTTSCGCRANIKLQKQKEIEKLYGQQFGYLIPFDYCKDEKQNKYKIKCKCICGNEHTVDKSDLIRGVIKSCGCKSKEINSMSHIVPLPIGYKSGKLQIIEPLVYQNNVAVYKCQCECGNIKYARHTSLAHKTIMSCGCIKSQGEVLTRQALQELNLNFVQEFSFKDLCSAKGGILKFDFAIFNNEQLVCLIEYDGLQHFLPYGWNTPDKLEEIKHRDQIKTEYCKLHHIPLLRLNFLAHSAENIKNIIIKFLQENKICNF